MVCRGHCSVVRPSQTKSDQPRSAQVQPTCPPENRFESTGDRVWRVERREETGDRRKEEGEGDCRGDGSQEAPLSPGGEVLVRV